MSLDGAFLHIVKTEMKGEGLINSRVDKIHQPSREEIILSFHTKSGSQKLLISANPSSARVCLTSKPIENPPTPPMFCQLMRKKLGGGRLLEIEQDGFERIISFKFLCYNEIGDEEKIILTVEIMGRSSNIILLKDVSENGEELKVIDAIKRITDEVSSVRRVLPGLIYQLPPREKRLNLLDFKQDELEQALQNHASLRLDKALIKIFEGICPLFARETAFRATGYTDIIASEVSVEKLNEFLTRVKIALTSAPEPVMLIDDEKKPFDFTFINIKQYGDIMNVIPYQSANELVDNFFYERADANRKIQRSGSMLKTLNNRYERVLRKIDARRSELDACAEREKFRKWGDLINANLYTFKNDDKSQKDANFIIAEDYETGEEVRIPLEPKLSPAKNAQKYYAEYKKLQNAEKTLTGLIKDGENELVYLDSVIDSANRAATDAELLEIKRELIETGYLGSSKLTKKGAKQEKASEPLKFVSSDNTMILVGRNNRQNDILTLKTSKPREIWLHAQNYAGSHVIIKNEKPSEQTLEEAAQIAAFCSKAKNSSRVPVDYTEVRYVKKPIGAKPGMVIFTNNKTLYVTPSEELYNRLRM
ncbi:MAG: NFACT family protein [Oscillospiraceae bacterium]|nr:NFACT family protein [Oscillospiraceae bacterium]